MRRSNLEIIVIHRYGSSRLKLYGLLCFCGLFVALVVFIVDVDSFALFAVCEDMTV